MQASFTLGHKPNTMLIYEIFGNETGKYSGTTHLSSLGSFPPVRMAQHEIIDSARIKNGAALWVFSDLLYGIPVEIFQQIGEHIYDCFVWWKLGNILSVDATRFQRRWMEVQLEPVTFTDGE
jgi:hypothetical protein